MRRRSARHGLITYRGVSVGVLNPEETAALFGPGGTAIGRASRSGFDLIFTRFSGAAEWMAHGTPVPAINTAWSHRSLSTSLWIDLTLEVPFEVIIKFAPLESAKPTQVPFYQRGDISSHC